MFRDCTISVQRYKELVLNGFVMNIFVLELYTWLIFYMITSKF